MQALYILCGYPYAGKSTLATKLVGMFGFEHIAIDDINSELGVGLDSSQAITQEQWCQTYQIFHTRIADSLRAGGTVLADAVAYRKDQRDELAGIAKQAHAGSFVIYVKTPLEIVRKRWMDNRAKHKRSDVRDDDFYNVVNNFEVPTSMEGTIVVLPETSDQELSEQFILCSQTLP